MKYAIGGIAASIIAVLLFTLPGCSQSSTTNILQTGASSAVALGLTAIPDSTQANTIATLASTKIQNEVLPLLNGSDAGLIAGLNDLLTLNVFNDPSLAKFKLILQGVMPILVDVLPANLVSSGTDQIPADVKADMISFFTGVKQGCDNYLASGKASGTRGGGLDYGNLRKQLAK